MRSDILASSSRGMTSRLLIPRALAQDSVHRRSSWGNDLLLGVLQTALMSAIAEACFMAGWVRLPATQERRTVEPE